MTLNPQEIVDTVTARGLALEVLQPDTSVVEPSSAEAMVRQAFAAPVDYPSVQESIIEGDRVVVVVDHPARVVNQVARSVAEYLASETGAEVAILVSPKSFRDFWQSQTGSFQIIEHDSDNENDLAMLAVGQQDQPLHVARTLFDADVVLAIQCHSVHERPVDSNCIVPTFMSEDNRHQFAAGSSSHRSSVIQQVNESLGTFAQIQIVLGAGERVDSIYFGEQHVIAKAADARLNELWRLHALQQYAVACGTIETESSESAWAAIVHAILALSECSTGSGAIVIVSDTRQKPSSEIQRAFAATDDDSNRKMRQDLRQLASIVNSHPIYLHSRLDEESVEELGLGYVADMDDLVRLVERHESAVLVRDAHLCQIDLEP